MKKNKLNLFILVILLVLPISFAACPEDIDCPWNKDAPEQFNYQTGDYSSIDWGNAIWSKIPPSRIPDVPADKLNYNQLNVDQRLATTTEQIVLNLEKINNLAIDVNEERAREAIEKVTQIKVKSLGQSAKIVHGILRATFGEEESLVFAGKEGWEVEIDENGEINHLGLKEIQESSISFEDSFTIQEETAYIGKDGSVLSVKSLSFRNGQSYVKLGNTARIDFYEILAETNPIDIHFNPLIKPEGNYIAISDAGLDIRTTKDGTVKIDPLPGNLLFNMVKRQYEKDEDGKLIKDKFTWVPDERDTLSITVLGGDNLEVISRAEAEKTPLLRHQNGGGKTSLENGRMGINVQEGKLTMIPSKPFEGKAGPIDQRNSVAMELISNNFADLLRTSSSNRYLLLRNDKPIGGNSLGLEVSDFIESNMMKTMDDLRVKHPQIDFSIGMATPESIEEYLKKGYGNPTPPEYQEITANLAQTTDQWLKGKTSLNKYISQVYFGTQLNAGGTLLTLSVGERMMDGSTISFNPAIRTGTTPLGTLDHEFKHILKGYIISKEASEVHLKDSPEYLVEEGLLLERFESEEITEKELNSQIMELGDKHLKAILKSRGIEMKENTIAVNLADEIYVSSSEDFEIMVEEVEELARKAQDLGKGVANGEHLKSLMLESKDSPLRADYIQKIGANLDYWTEEKIEGAEDLRNRYTHFIREETGFYPYAFRAYGGNYEEIFSVYSELPIPEAKKCLSCAQLEYDLVISTDPPDWLWQQAEERYYQIMGGKDGSYCSKNPCGPCLKYKLTCKAE
ncbi:hypothetical protein J4417_00275 [Candidatus Woesearchaeota archaeon]|nr:hypothetical protein [Candidatus Woesearchaeota archaeon]